MVITPVDGEVQGRVLQEFCRNAGGAIVVKSIKPKVKRRGRFEALKPTQPRNRRTKPIRLKIGREGEDTFGHWKRGEYRRARRAGRLHPREKNNV